MATKEISDAIEAIPSKKAHLRKTFETLQSYSSSLASFTLQWQDLEDHFSSLERSIDARFKQLQSLAPSSPPPAEAAAAPAPAPADEPRPELKSFCTNMDSKGLWSYIITNRKQLPAIRSELTSAIRLAPDPDSFVLDAIENFYPPEMNQLKHMHLLDFRRTSIHLLEEIRLAVPEVGASARDKAKKMALEWKKKIEEGDGENSFEALGFLRLVLAYRLVPEIEADFLLDLLVRVSRRPDTVDLLKKLGLTEKVSDFIQKLNSKGKNLDAVKFVYAFNLLDSYPPEPLLKAYLKQSKKAVQELRKKCNNSSQSEHDASSKEIAALKNVIKVVDEYKLHSEFSCDKLNKRIEQLEKQLEKHKADKKRAASSAVASNFENQKQLRSKKHMQQLENQKQQQSNKRLRPSTSISQPVAATYQLSPLLQNQPQLGMAERAPHCSRLYPLTTSEYLYGRADPCISGSSMVLGGNPTSLTSYGYSTDSLASSGLYNRSVTYGGYSLSGMSTGYGSSHFP